MRVLVTGAAGGIGAAIVRALGTRGAALHLVDLDGERLAAVARAHGATWQVCDLSTEAGVTAAFAPYPDGPDVVIGASGRGFFGGFRDVGAATYRKAFDANFVGPVAVALEAVRRWRRAGRAGRLLALSSQSGIRVYPPAAYVASKFALESAMDVVAFEVDRDGGAAGTICPGNVATDFWQRAEGKATPTDLVPPEHVARAVLAWLDCAHPPRRVWGSSATTYGRDGPWSRAASMRRLWRAGHTWARSGVAVVTGASSGVGRATAIALAARGWRVGAIARRGDALRALAAAAPGVVPLVADVTDEAAVEDALRALRAAHGPVDLLVNNAGYSAIVPPLDLPFTALRDVACGNVLAYAVPTRALADELCERRGTILDVNSITALRAEPSALPYSAAKRALAGLASCWRAELEPRGVRVCDLFLGNVATPFFENAATADGRAAPIPPSAMPVDDAVAALLGLLDSRANAATVPRSYLRPRPKSWLREQIRQVGYRVAAR